MTAQEGREGEGGSLGEKGEEQTMLGEQLLIIYHLLYISMSNPEERMLYKHWVWVGGGVGLGGAEVVVETQPGSAVKKEG